MPQTPPANFFNPTPSADFLAGVAVGKNMTFKQIARGIAAAYMDPFGAALTARAYLASAFAVYAGQVVDNAVRPSTPQWSTSLPDGKGAINLGDDYTLKLDETNSQIVIINEKTGVTTNVWGDPHCDVNGQRQFDFYGTTTFVLDNGTKVTIKTEQWNGNPDAYVASQVVITKGSNAIVVDGISQNKLGDLTIRQSQNGRAIDAATADGKRVFEGAAGWLDGETGRLATQADMDVTRNGVTVQNWDESGFFNAAFSFALSSFLLTGALGLLMAGAAVEERVRLSLGARAAVRG